MTEDRGTHVLFKESKKKFLNLINKSNIKHHDKDELTKNERMNELFNSGL